MNALRRLSLMLGALGALFAVVVIFNLLVNPYGAWRINLIDRVYRKVLSERIAIPYMLRTARPKVMLLGTSRVMLSMRVAQGWRGDVLNAGLSAASLDEQAGIVRLALKNPDLKLVVWGIDLFAFDRAREHDCDPGTCARLAGQPFRLLTDTLLSLDVLEASRKEVARFVEGRKKLSPDRTLPIPWPEPVVCSQLAVRPNRGLFNMQPAQVQYQLVHHAPGYAGFQLSERQLILFASLVQKLRARGVRVIFFVPPVSEYEMEMIRQGGAWESFLRWQRELLKVGSYWEFAGYDAIARDDTLFFEVMHFRPDVGNMLLRFLEGKTWRECPEAQSLLSGSALWVDPSTIDHVIEVQNQRMRAALSQENHYTPVVAAALAERSPGLLSAKLEDQVKFDQQVDQ